MKFNNLFKHQQLLVYMYVKEASHNYGRFNIRYDADKVIRLGITRNRKSLNQLLYTLKKAWFITNDKHSGYWRIVDFIMCEKLVNSLDDFSYDMFNNMNQQPKVFSEDRQPKSKIYDHKEADDDNEINLDILNCCKKAIAEKDIIIKELNESNARLKTTDSQRLMKVNELNTRCEYLENNLHKIKKVFMDLSSWIDNIIAGTGV